MQRRPDGRDNRPPNQGDTQPHQRGKGRKESRRFKKPPDPTHTVDNSVVNLSKKALSTDHLDLLSKGLTFCPTPSANHPCHTLRDVFLFNRRIRLTHHFNTDSTTPRTPDTNAFNAFKPSSGWTPPPGKDHFVDSFASSLISHVTSKPLHLHSSRNLTPGEINALRDLKSDDSVIIKPADKGGAIVLQNVDDYIREGMRQLSNSDHYEKSTLPLFEASGKKIKTYLTNLVKASYLPANSHLNLTYKDPRLPSLYLLPKIHKNNNPGRPIISATGGPTEKISALVDSILKPLVTALPSHVRDSTDFINQIQTLTLPLNHTLLTIDVSSLYTNIPHAEGIEACRTHLLSRTLEDPPTRFVLTLIRFILTLNYFEFNGRLYHQVSGTAMGTKMAPNYANLFMGELEKKLINLHPVKPTLWIRYIDDIFCIYPAGPTEAQGFLSFLNDQHPTIKFTADISQKTVHFLDVEITVGQKGELHTSLYRKPTDTYRYLHYNSFHPTHQKKAIPYSQFIRVRRVCSDKRDFYRYTDEMIQALALRKYPMKLLLDARKKASQTERSTLLNPPPRPVTEKNIPLIVTFDPQHSHISSGLTTVKFLLDQVRPPLNAKPMLTFRRNNNLKNLLVRSKLGHSTDPRGTSHCGKPRCETCPHLRNTRTVRSTSNSKTFRVACNATCRTTDIVYLIECSLCGLQYIGQTNNPLHIRFQQHV